MTTWFKINTALIICLAFIFRLLFVNLPLLPNVNGASHKGGKHSSVMKKRRRSPEIAVRSNTKDYAVIEVCEENQDNEENEIKTNTPVLLSFLYSLFSNFNLNPGSDNAFDSIKCHLYPKRYLAFSILRV